MRRQGTYTKRVSAPRQAKRNAKRGWRWWRTSSKAKKFLVIGGPILAFLVITPLLTYAVFARDIGNQERLMNRNNTGVEITDKNRAEIYSFGRAKHHELVPLSAISDTTEKALLASEDKDFYKHGGVSVRGVLGALYGNFVSGGANYGGSTITQQLAKNTVLSSDRTFLRKYQELSISIAIEQKYSKDEILDMYLNSVYYGEGAFGIEDAAKMYFNKSPADLTLAESAMLIGVLPAPSAYSPISGSAELAKQRQTTVLTRMVNTGAITEAEKQAALAEPLAYAPISTDTNKAPHFVEMVLNELYKKYGEEKVTRSGYQIQTGLDLGMQSNLETNVANNMAFIKRNGGSNAGAVAIDPATGEVRALVGSADYTNETFGKVNMVTTSRQPGSSFKPIYYAEALATGVIYPSKIYEDTATDFNGYKPQNASRTYSGNISVRNALSRSLNIPSVKVMQDLGVDNALGAAKRLGITSLTGTDYGLPLALGSGEVSLMQMTSAYSAFANQGVRSEPVLVTKIKDKYDATIFTAKKTAKQSQTAEGAYLISDILSDQAARSVVFGSSINVPGYKAAVKTGTTDDSRDAWTIGYTPQIAIGVWVGNNDNTAMANGGSAMAGPIWRNTMKYALTGVTSTEFTRPSSIINRSVCTSNGLIAENGGTGTYTDIFISTKLPSGSCNNAPVKQEATKQPEEEEDTETTPTDDEDTTTTDPVVPTAPTTPTTPTTPGTGTGSTGTGSTGTGTTGTGTGTVPTRP